MPASEDPRKHPPRAAQPEIWEAVEPDIPALRSSAREIVGRPFDFSDDTPAGDEAPKPETLRELEVYDEIVSLGRHHRAKPSGQRRKTTPDQLAVIRWLDRFGYMTTQQLRRSVRPKASLRSMQILLQCMHRAGLVEWRRTQLALREDRPRGGSRPRLWSLTRSGYQLGRRSPGFYRPVIPPDRAWRRSRTEKPARFQHDLHVVSWWLAFHAFLNGGVEIQDAFTPRYEQGQIVPPRMPHGRGSRPIELRDISLGEGHVFADVPNDPFIRALHPDLTIRLQICGFLLGRADDAHVDLMLELDLSERAAYNHKKFARYDAFLTGWSLLHPRVEEMGTRPIVLFTSTDERRMLGLMKTADEVMTGRIGRLGDPEYQWYFPGRDHMLFTTEDRVHRGSLRAWRLPEHPKWLREALCDDRFPITSVAILPQDVVPWKGR